MSTEVIFRILAFLLIGGAVAISGTFRRRADRADQKMDFKAENPWLLKLRGIAALTFYLGMLVYLIYPPLIAWAAIPAWPLALRWLGLALMALMLPLLYWMFASLGKNITPTVKTRSGHELVTDGPYRYIRHPLYTFGSLFFFGFCLLAGNALLLVSAVIALSALSARTPFEEQMLIERFGDQYKEYMKRTGRYFPKLRLTP